MNLELCKEELKIYKKLAEVREVYYTKEIEELEKKFNNIIKEKDEEIINLKAQIKRDNKEWKRLQEEDVCF